MNYQKIYNMLVEKRLTDKISRKICYCEEHHIIPRGLGGSDKKSNLVMLTAREHFIAHLLLSKIYSGKMWVAFFFMCSKNSASAKNIIPNTWQYEKAKKESSKIKSKMYTGEKNPFFGKKHSGATIEKIVNNRISIVGSKHHNFNEKKINFMNSITLKQEYCTQNFLRKKYLLDHRGLSEVANGNRKSYKSWFNLSFYSIEDIKNPKNIGKLHYKINNEKFNFIREDGETFLGTKYDLHSKYIGLHESGIRQICSGKTKSHKQWRIL